MGLLTILGEETKARSPLRFMRRLEAWRAAIPREQQCLLNAADNVVMLAVTGDRYDRIGGHVLLLLETEEPATVHAIERFDCARERTTERMSGPKRLGEEFVHVMIGLVAIHQQLFLDHATFLGDLGGREAGVQIHVREYVEQGVEMLVARLRVVAGGLLTRKGIEVTAHPFDGLADLLGAAAVGAFEEQMLDEMRSAAQAGGFIAATHAHPYAERNAVHIRHLGRGNAHAAGKLCDFKHNIPRGL